MPLPNGEPTQKEKDFFMTKLADQAARRDEVTEWIKKVAESREELSKEERNMLLQAYQNVAGGRLASLKVVQQAETTALAGTSSWFSKSVPPSRENADNAAAYKTKVEDELKANCEEILTLLKDCLLPSSTTEESKVFYHKMQGDIEKNFVAEYTKGEAHDAALEEARLAYKEAMSHAALKQIMTHPSVLLGLVYNALTNSLTPRQKQVMKILGIVLAGGVYIKVAAKNPGAAQMLMMLAMFGYPMLMSRM